MDLISFLVNFLQFILVFINSITFFLLLLLILFIYNLIMYFFRDRKYLKEAKKIKDPVIKSFDELNSSPLINIIVPAWKEGNAFKECLKSLNALDYPNIKVIVNAGGNDETIDIANHFKDNENFLILRQEAGMERAALGKIKALNDCIPHITSGLFYFIDADCYITDKLLLRLLTPICNFNEMVVAGGNRPFETQMENDLVKYLQFHRLSIFKKKMSRYSTEILSGANTIVKYEVMEKVGKFEENRKISEDISRGRDIISKGFKIYSLHDYGARIQTEYPSNFKELLEQRRRYIENSFYFSYKSKRKKYFLKFLLLIFVSFYIILFPLFLFFNLGFFFIGVSIFLMLYMKSIRKLLFFRKAVEKEFWPHYGISFFLKMICYIYVEQIINIISFLGIFKYLKKMKS